MQLQSDLSKSYIAEALIQLMEKKAFSTITNKNITDRAGVSHITIYRNFSSKEDILKYYLKNIFSNWSCDWKNDGNTAYQIFTFFKKHTDLIGLLYKSNMQHLLIDNILELYDYNSEDTSAIAYSKVAVAYLIFGWCNEWYKRGMLETPEEMAKLYTQKN